MQVLTDAKINVPYQIVGIAFQMLLRVHIAIMGLRLTFTTRVVWILLLSIVRLFILTTIHYNVGVAIQITI